VAVEPQSSHKPQLVKDFWPRFKRGAVFLIIGLQVLILIAIAALLSSSGFFKDNPLVFTATLVAQSILGIVASLVIYRFVAKPIKYLLAALVHVAGEPTNSTPPNPNEAHFERSGLKPVLRTVYQLASDIKDPIEEGRETRLPTPVGETTPANYVTDFPWCSPSTDSDRGARIPCGQSRHGAHEITVQGCNPLLVSMAGQIHVVAHRY
jgi:hypothetical protein